MLKKILYTAVLCWLVPVILYGAMIGDQTAGPSAVINFSNAAKFVIPTGPVGEMPSDGLVQGGLYWTTDSTNTTDCTVGGGSVKVLCGYTGVSWLPLDRQVDSVNGHTGAVVLDSTDLADFDTAVTNNSAVVLNTAKISYPGNELTADEQAAVSGAATPSSSNVFATMDDVPANLGNLPAAGTVDITSSTGTDTTLPAATTALAGVMTGTDKNSLDSLVTLSGNAAGATDNGTFSGTTIPDNSTTRAAMSALETAVELRGTNTTTMNIYTADDCSVISGMVAGDLCFEY